MPKIAPEISTKWHRFETLTSHELYELLRFRQNIFVVEQRSPYLDLDGLDQRAWHLLARVRGELAGYLRLMPTGGLSAPVRIGRVAVSLHLRRHGIGRALMHHALTFCHQRYPWEPIALGAQLRLVPFYESFGFAAASEPYDDCGVEHIEMTLKPDR
jgi:ElaA protein